MADEFLYGYTDAFHLLGCCLVLRLVFVSKDLESDLFNPWQILYAQIVFFVTVNVLYQLFLNSQSEDKLVFIRASCQIRDVAVGFLLHGRLAPEVNVQPQARVHLVRNIVGPVVGIDLNDILLLVLRAALVLQIFYYWEANLLGSSFLHLVVSLVILLVSATRALRWLLLPAQGALPDRGGQ